jgi:hypothetical protein
MRRTSLFALVLLSSTFSMVNFSIAQQPDLQEVNYDISYLIGKSDSNFILLERKSSDKITEGDLMISSYTDGMKRLWTCDDNSLDHTCSTENIFYFNNNVYLMSEKHNDYKQTQDFRIENIINSKGINEKKSLPVFSINEWKESKKVRQPIYQFDRFLSTTTKHVLLTYSNDYKDSFNEGFEFRILNESNVLSERKQITLPYADPLCNIEGIVYDDSNGDIIYLLAKVFDVSSIKSRKVVKSEIYRYNLLDSSLTKKEIPMDNSAGDIRFFKANNHLYNGFLYTEPGSKLTSGIKILKIDEQLNVEATFFQPYIYNFKDSVYFTQHGDSNPYNLVDLSVLDNNDLVAVSEKNNFSTSVTNGFIVFAALGGMAGMLAGALIMPIYSSGQQYESGSMLVSYFGQEPGSGYTEKIIKYQRDPIFQHVSHVFMESDSCAYLLFTKDSLRKNSSVADLATYKISIDGCVEENLFVIPAGISNPRPKSGSCISFDKSNFIIAAADRRKNYLMRLTQSNRL